MGLVIGTDFLFGTNYSKNLLKSITFKNVWKYVCMIVFLWIITIPFWRFFIHNIMESIMTKIY